MTNKQKQCLLCYLGLYSGDIDGIWGNQSTTATREFQKQQGLVCDGIFGSDTERAILEAICRNTDDFWCSIRHFDRQEFACKCGRYCDGFPVEPDPVLVSLAQRLRNHFGVPVKVSSGVRCPKHNANVGGVANSRHLTGKAMDFAVEGKSSAQVLEYIQTQPEVRYAYAIDKHYVHMDVA